MIIAYISDHVEHRFTFVLGSLAVCITGEIVLLTVYDKQRISVQYFALFLVTSGTYGGVPILISWFTNNCKSFFLGTKIRVPICAFMVKLTDLTWGIVGGHHRRCIGSAFQIGFANGKITSNLCNKLLSVRGT